MDNTTETAATVETSAPAAAAEVVEAPAKPKKTRRVVTRGKKAAKPAPEKAPRKAKEPAVHFHRQTTGLAPSYTGPSEPLNANRAVKIRLDLGAREEATERMQKTLYDLRKAYGGRQFPAKGIDNGVLANLKVMGLIALTGGAEERIGGTLYLRDGASPVQVKVTPKGMAYGKA